MTSRSLSECTHKETEHGLNGIECKRCGEDTQKCRMSTKEATRKEAKSIVTLTREGEFIIGKPTE
ncbi:hypothetical protein GOV10_03465 [Candidatus Woesearchaeota archaeon]|nr:hypothetical protein [Candidatus Woesearchaeota archaeon]